MGASGVGALIAGGLLLFDTGSPGFDVSVPAVIAGGVAIGGLTLFAASKALSAGRATARGGPEELIGAVGSVRSPLDPTGQVFVDGALWRAQATEDATLAEGERAVVERVDGLTLWVRRAASSDRSPEEGAAGAPSNPNERSTS
jgi:membrane-bound serine protease (ClpP class)